MNTLSRNRRGCNDKTAPAFHLISTLVIVSPLKTYNCIVQSTVRNRDGINYYAHMLNYSQLLESFVYFCFAGAYFAWHRNISDEHNTPDWGKSELLLLLHVAIFWVVTPCSDVAWYPCEGGNSMVIPSVGILPQYCTLSQPIGPQLESPSPWEKKKNSSSSASSSDYGHEVGPINNLLHPPSSCLFTGRPDFRLPIYKSEHGWCKDRSQQKLTEIGLNS
jgi:hypothetical protein